MRKLLNFDCAPKSGEKCGQWKILSSECTDKINSLVNDKLIPIIKQRVGPECEFIRPPLFPYYGCRYNEPHYPDTPTSSDNLTMTRMRMTIGDSGGFSSVEIMIDVGCGEKWEEMTILECRHPTGTWGKYHCHCGWTDWLMFGSFSNDIFNVIELVDGDQIGIGEYLCFDTDGGCKCGC